LEGIVYLSGGLSQLLLAYGSLEDNGVEPVEKSQGIGNKKHPNQDRDSLRDLLEDGVFPPPFFSAQPGYNIQNCDEQK
jgi:hypothetical protein